MPNCCRTPIPKFHAFMLPLSLVAGPLKMWTVTLKWAHTKNKICSLACLNAKTEELLEKKIVLLFLDQKPFCPFWKKRKNYLTNCNFKFYYWRLFFDILGRILHIFEILFLFLGPCNFLKIKTLPSVCDTRECGEICRFFGIDLLKIYVISRNM